MKAKNLCSIAKSVIRSSSRAVNLPTPQKRRLKVAIWLLLLLGCLGQARAATPVSGRVDGQTWTCDRSPYVVTANVQVASLTILPGVVVQFQSNYVFQVIGWLRASGTEAAPICFTTTNSVGGWGGIYLDEVQSGSWLVHCNIQGSSQSGIRITQCVPEILNCVIQNNSNVFGGGILVSNTQAGLGELLLSRCTISGNTSRGGAGGIYALMGPNRLKLVDCIITENTANATRLADNSVYGGGVYVDGDSVFIHCSIISNAAYACATTTGNSDGGGIFISSGDALLRNCVIANNVAATYNCGGSTRNAYGGGIFINTGTLTNFNCLIASNIVGAASVEDGAGVYSQNALKVYFENCTIAYNSDVAIRGSGGSNTIVRNSIIWGNNGVWCSRKTGQAAKMVTDKK